MKLKDILAISGWPGLYKFVAQSTNGIIVESLADGRRSNAPVTARVSAMSEIAIFTDTEEKPLFEIFETLYKMSGGKESLSSKATPDQLKAKFAEVLPAYDRDRVHVSDMKKVFNWYNILVNAGMTDFKIEEVVEEEGKETSKEKKPVKEKTAIKEKTVTPKAKTTAKSASPKVEKRGKVKK